MTIIGKTFSINNRPETLTKELSYTGKILRVNLNNGRIWVEEPEEAFYRKLIGGRGFILHYLLTELPSRIDALDAQNLLIFAPGVLSGTVLPGTGRHAVGAKSPLTGALASAEAGGWFGSELKRTGFDAIIIQGRSDVPVYLWIKDGTVEIKDASHLWGKTVGDTHQMIADELDEPKIRSAIIGPAGENLVRYAAVIHDKNRAAGRSGLGAVMGSKNLKAVIVRGSNKVGLADKALMQTVQRWINSNYKTLMSWAVTYGTSGSVKFNHDSGGTAIRNYLDNALEGIENLDARSFFQYLLKDRDTCNQCPVRCKLVVEYHDKDLHIDPRYGGPEYETIGAMGPLCGINDAIAVAKAHELCSAYGLDTISTGATIAFTMECAAEGLLSGYDFLPSFGNAESLIESIHRIAKREGIGNEMAEGSARMAQKLGEKAQSILAVARGQELPLHDPRYKNLCAMGYALSATGADHQHNLIDNFANFPGSEVCLRLEEMGVQTPLPLWGINDHKIEGFVYETAFKNFLDSAVICHFYPYQFKHVADALGGACGWDMTPTEIYEIGSRIINMARLFLIREGFTDKDDTLSARAFYKLSSGPIAGRGLTPEELKYWIQKYYMCMGWSNEGAPTPETLAHLNINYPIA